MKSHKFKVGQTVRLISGTFADRSGQGTYEVVRAMPSERGEYSYRIKAPLGGTERAVSESLIELAQ